MKITLDNGQEITPTATQKNAIEYVLNHYRDSPQKITLDSLYTSISEYLGIDNYDIRSRRRELVYPRQIFSIIAHKALGYSLKEIGDRIGRLDHTSVIHSIERIKMLLAVEEPVRKDLDNVCALVGVVNPMEYRLPKKPELLTLVPTAKQQREKIQVIPPEIFIRHKADHTNRNYLQEYGV